MKQSFPIIKQFLWHSCRIRIDSISKPKITPNQDLPLQDNPFVDYLVRFDRDFLPSLFQTTMHRDTVYEGSYAGYISFFLYPGENSDTVFLLGPLKKSPFSYDDLQAFLSRFSLSPQTEQQVRDYFSSLPVIPSNRIYPIIELTIQQLTGSTLPLRFVQEKVHSSVGTYAMQALSSPKAEISKMRDVELRYEQSAILTEAVKQGNYSLAYHLIGQYAPGENTDIRNQNPLRNAQNYCIVMNTQFRHAMEERGIHPYKIDKLSNEIGLQIEQLTEGAKLKEFFAYALKRYCDLVHEDA